MLEAVRIRRDRVVEQPIEVSGFGGNMPLTLGYIKVDLLVGAKPAGV